MTCLFQRLKEKAAHPFPLKLNSYFEPSLCLQMILPLCDDPVSTSAGTKCSCSLSVSDEIPVQLLLLNSVSYLASGLLELDAAGIFSLSRAQRSLSVCFHSAGVTRNVEAFGAVTRTHLGFTLGSFMTPSEPGEAPNETSGNQLRLVSNEFLIQEFN